MPRSAKRFAGDQLRRLSTWLVQGKQFRHYAPRNPPAAAGDRLRIALPYLIPNLGDTVMLFPLIDAVRYRHPDAEISCFTFGGSRILRQHPSVDHHYEIRTSPDWREIFGRPAYIHDLYRQWKQNFRDLRFHSVVMLRAGVDPFHSAHLGWMLGGQDRTGYSSEVEPERQVWDFHPDPLLSRTMRPIGRVHEAERGSEVLELAGLIENPVDIRQPVESVLSIARTEAAAAFVATYPELREPYAILAPGSSFPRRRWDAECFAEVARLSILPRGWTPVLVGGPEDAELCQRVLESLRAPKVLNLAGKTNFAELAGVCAGAKCFVGNDSGTGHVAGACGVPTVVVAMFRRHGPVAHHSSPMRTHPIGPHVRVVQPPAQRYPCINECEMDHAHCILGVTVEDVSEALAGLLTESLQTARAKVR